MAEKSPYKLGLQIRPFGRTRGTWSNPRRFRPHPPATDPSRLARPPGRRWTPWSGQVPPARQLAPRRAPPSRPHAPCPGRRTGPGARLRGPWLRAPPGGRRTNVGAGGPVRLRPRSAHGYRLRGPRFTDSPQGRGPGGSGLGGQPEGAQIYIFHTPTPHPAPRGPPTHLSSQHGT